jgi:hypothetical protein
MRIPDALKRPSLDTSYDLLKCSKIIKSFWEDEPPSDVLRRFLQQDVG